MRRAPLGPVLGGYRRRDRKLIFVGPLDTYFPGHLVPVSRAANTRKRTARATSRLPGTDSANASGQIMKNRSSAGARLPRTLRWCLAGPTSVALTDGCRGRTPLCFLVRVVVRDHGPTSSSFDHAHRPSQLFARSHYAALASTSSVEPCQLFARFHFFPPS